MHGSRNLTSASASTGDGADLSIPAGSIVSQSLMESRASTVWAISPWISSIIVAGGHGVV
jgi:hypothetical protein